MTYISLDKSLLQNLIDAINSYAQSHDFEVGEVKWINWTEDDPAGVGYRVANGSTLAGMSTTMTTLSGEIQVRLDEAVAMNESGITMSDGNTVSYYLPDGGEDTVENVRAYNSKSLDAAKSEATALYQATNSPNGRSEDGRTIDEIYAEMAKHQDVPTYSAAYIQALDKAAETRPYSEEDINKTGAELFLELMNRSRDSYSGEVMPPHFSTLGHMLAAASQDEVGGASLAKDVYPQDGSTMSLASKISLNAALSETPTRFGTRFLVDIASRSEGQDPNQGGMEGEDVINLTRYNADVLGGALTAMGNNPKAALDYLASAGGTVDANGTWTPNDAAQSRWDRLKHRDWNQAGLDGFTAALGAASSYRNVTGDTGDVIHADARATWLAGNTISHFGGGDVKKEDFSEKMKENLSLVIANSPEEVSVAAEGADLEDTDGAKLPTKPQAITNLTYRVIDNENAAATIATGLGDYHHDHIDRDMQSGDMTTLKGNYESAAASQGYIERLIESRLTDNKEDAEKRKTAIDTAASVFTTVAATGVTVATAGTSAAVLAPFAVDVGTTIAKPVVVDALTEGWGEDRNKDDSPGTPRDILEAQGYTDAAQYGLLSDESIALAQKQGLLLNADGSVIEVPPGGYSDSYLRKVQSWKKKAGDPATQEVSDSIDSGLDDGREQASKLLTNKN
ncbi:DUF6571 domain-containing protein [Actinomyces slackii]|uniref:DUF6571 domain-containing protein n=1 Tax=Actinomyces slackii TaxID=52774 RepID=A0A3S4SDV5_9ACTO|nr:DUF6571 family protein [Actinomyces slackii]VEG73809.1 Uncharacterised protein [Actinomyces slackii]